MNKKTFNISEQEIIEKIHWIRGKKVMIDSDIAELYSVETKRLNEQVKRNIERFPEHFMIQLTKEEFANLKSQIATSSWGGRRSLPYAFTEHGILMSSNILQSRQAIQMSIRIIEVFVNIRERLLMNDEILKKINSLELDLANQEKHLGIIFKYLEKIKEDSVNRKNQEDRKRIGFKRTDENK